MRTIINGKLYDTDNANMLGGFYNWDMEYGETLYKTGKGQYFINNQFPDGKDEINLISEEKITEWIEKNRKHIDEDVFETLLNIIPYQEG